MDILLLVAFNVFLSIWPDSWPACAQEFEIFSPPSDEMTFRWLLLAMVGANFVASWLCEFVLTDKVIGNIDTGKPKKYELISKQLKTKPDWPPLTEETSSNIAHSEEESPRIIEIEDKSFMSAQEAMDKIL